MIKYIGLIALFIVLLVSTAGAEEKLKIAIQGKYDGEKVQLRWMVSDKSTNYHYVLWRAPADDIKQRTRMADLGMLPYEDAKQRLAENEAALKLMYPFKAAANRAEINQSLAQEDNRLGMLLFVSTMDKQVAAALGQYYVDTDVAGGGQRLYTIEAYDGDTLVATFTSPVNLDKPEVLPIVWNVKAHKFKWGVGLKWGGYEPYTTFNIYRRGLMDEKFTKINTAPVQVQTKRNMDGTLSVAPYFYSDTTVKENQLLYYQVRGVDFFGDEGPTSIEVMGKVKKDYRPAPLPRPEIEEGETSLTIVWQKAADEKVISYNVYRSRNPDESFVQLNKEPLLETTFVDNHVVIDLNYFYYITAVNNGGFESIPSLAASGFAKDATPPAVVVQLQADVIAADINLKWASVADADLLGYRVYRTMKPKNLDWALLNQIPLDKVVFTDALTKNLSRYPYYYRVTAVDIHYNESQPSEPIKIQLPDVTPPGAPSVAGYLVKNQQVALNWHAVKSYDMAGYHVYRFVDNQKTRLTATLLTLPTFVDPNPPVGKQLEYQVTALDLTGNESAPSDMIHIVAKDSIPPRLNALKIDVKGSGVNLKVVSKDTDLAGFDVYRSRNNRDYVKVNKNRVKDGLYTDQVLKGKRYFYKVVLWDTSANKTESAAREVKLPK